MSKKYSEFEQYLNPGGHLINLDDETWEEVNEYLDSDRGDELLDEVRESLNQENLNPLIMRLRKVMKRIGLRQNYIQCLNVRNQKDPMRIKN